MGLEGQQLSPKIFYLDRIFKKKTIIKLYTNNPNILALKF